MKRQCNQLVIGSGLSAIVYAYLNDALYVNNNPDHSPFLFDCFEPDFPLGMFGVEAMSRTLKTNHKDKKVGYSKAALRQRLSFVLSLAGNAPLGSKVSSIRINSEEDVARIITADNAALEYKYKRAVIFDPRGIQGITPEPDIEEELFRIEDYFDMRSGGKHSFDYVSTGDKFVNEIFFYPSPRMTTVKSKIKDLVAVSYMTREQLNDIDYSDVAARFKILKILKDLGLRGARNGRDPKNPDRYKYYAVRIEARKREVSPATRQNYKNVDNIRFDTRSPEQVILQHSFEENMPYKMLKGLFTL